MLRGQSVPNDWLLLAVYSSFLLLYIAKKQLTLQCKANSLSFVRTDDATKDSEKTGTAFTIKVKLEVSNPGERGQKPIEAVSFRRIATVEQLQLEYTHTHEYTHSQLYRIPRATMPRGINKVYNYYQTIAQE